MSSKIATLAAAMIALGLFAGSAMAQIYPANIAGTWAAQANQSRSTIVITQGGATGPCHSLSGTFDTGDIEGFYCSASGRFNFARSNSAGVTIQYYSGNVSQTGSHLFMGGTIGVPTTAGGLLGEYSFFAVK